ncbi:MAG: Rossmann-fold NAD(P)-binding domain-containing protein [Candidatus Aminicenantales bacterium]
MTNLIAIRREDKNPWEKRVALIPSHIRDLVKNHGLKFLVQPAPNRVFADADFKCESAKVQEDISDARIVLGIKEMPDSFFEPDKVYVFFSHTIKGQKANMPMLRRMADVKCTLIDYEKIVDEKNRRLVFFGRQAGAAGMIESLWALARRLNAEGLPHPFGSVRRMTEYQSLVEAKENIDEIGQTIRRDGLPEHLVPFICGFTGYGHVSQGAQEIFDILPEVEIAAEEFPSFIASGNFSSHRVYKIVFREEHLVRPRSVDKAFDLQDYYDHPEEYGPVLESYLPFLDVLINGIYWAPKYPHFVSKAFIRELYGGPSRPKLRVLGDVSCDVEGGIECTLKATNPKDSVFVYDPVNDAAIDGVEGPGPVVMSVYNLPAEIPLESSVFFSQALFPFIPAIAAADFSRDFASCRLPDPIKKAVILFRGEFTPDYQYMKAFL